MVNPPHKASFLCEVIFEKFDFCGMGTKLTKYRGRILRALNRVGGDVIALGPQIETLAGALMSLELANNEIAGLSRVTVEEEGRFGGTTIRPHPAFKIQRDAQDSVTKQLKSLGLTAADIPDNGDDDPLIELTRRLIDE